MAAKAKKFTEPGDKQEKFVWNKRRTRKRLVEYTLAEYKPKAKGKGKRKAKTEAAKEQPPKKTSKRKTSAKRKTSTKQRKAKAG